MKVKLESDIEYKALRDEKQRILVKIDEIRQRPEDVLKEEAFSFLEIDDEHKYRKKIKGFTLPFSTHAKNDI